jgi:hypothetical protein
MTSVTRLEAPGDLLERQLALFLVPRRPGVLLEALGRPRGEDPERTAEEVEHHAIAAARRQEVPLAVAGGGRRVDAALARPPDESCAAHVESAVAVEPLELVESPRAPEVGEAQRHDAVFPSPLLRSARVAGRLVVAELGLQLVELRVDGRLESHLGDQLRVLRRITLARPRERVRSRRPRPGRRARA